MICGGLVGFFRAELQLEKGTLGIVGHVHLPIVAAPELPARIAHDLAGHGDRLRMSFGEVGEHGTVGVDADASVDHVEKIAGQGALHRPSGGSAKHLSAAGA
ncbi:MAG: hypothetical protein QOC72_1386 [Methylobacteriaceae bacterium]|nr:hypothetical protein [Methylobacteriaceae bacterium]